MKIVFIGAGNVASHLALALYKCGFEIIQIYSRSNESADMLAKQVGAMPTSDISTVADDADLYIFAVKDSVLESLITRLPANKGLYLHTAGSIPLEIFAQYTQRYGVLYPLQTFTKGRDICWKTTPIFTEANTENDLKLIDSIAGRLSDKVSHLDSDKRRYLHLTGVFACNFVNHMYAISDTILKEAGLSFDNILPLIDETCNKVHSISPAEAQTGPAVRFDENVMNKHLELLNNEQIREIYRQLSLSIHALPDNK